LNVAGGGEVLVVLDRYDLIESPAYQAVKYDPKEYFDDINDYVKENNDAVDCLC
jgi:hypothetical protein